MEARAINDFHTLHKLSQIVLGQFQYKILAWLRDEREWNKRHHMFIPQPRCDFFSYVPSVLSVNWEFKYVEIAYCKGISFKYICVTHSINP